MTAMKRNQIRMKQQTGLDEIGGGMIETLVDFGTEPGCPFENALHIWVAALFQKHGRNRGIATGKFSCPFSQPFKLLPVIFVHVLASMRSKRFSLAKALGLHSVLFGFFEFVHILDESFLALG